MIKFIKSFFGGSKPAEQPAPAVPYKVETPAEPVQPVVNNPGVTAVEVALDLEAGAPVVAPTAKTKKPRATKSVAEKKPAAAKKAPAKKPAAKKPKAK
jgi:hypothetical protein